MRLTCPRCKRLIPAGQINVERDVALCAGCDEAFVLSDMLAEGRDAEVDVGVAPPGAWFQETFDGWEAGASTRSWQAIFLVPFACVWSGGSLGGIYGSQIVHGQFSLLISLFGIPFLLGSIALWTLTVMSLCGKVKISVAGDDARLFCGALGVGRRKQFDWSSIKSVKECVDQSSRNSASRMLITLSGPDRSPIRTGAMLNRDRLDFLTQVLRSKLTKR